jgi:hypothetical protein
LKGWYVLDNTAKLYYLKAYTGGVAWIQTNDIMNSPSMAENIRDIYLALAKQVEEEIKLEYYGLNADDIGKVLNNAQNVINGTLQAILDTENIQGSNVNEGQGILRALRSARAGTYASNFLDTINEIKKESKLLSDTIPNNYFEEENLKKILDNILYKEDENTKGMRLRTEKEQQGAVGGHISNLQSLFTENLVTKMLDNVDEDTRKALEEGGVVKFGESGEKFFEGKRSKADSTITIMIDGNEATLGISIKAYLGKSSKTFKAVQEMAAGDYIREGASDKYKAIYLLATKISSTKTFRSTLQDRKLLAAIFADVAIGGSGLGRALAAIKFTARKGDTGIDVSVQFLSDYYRDCAGQTIPNEKTKIYEVKSVPNITALQLSDQSQYGPEVSLSRRLSSLKLTIFAPISLKQGG